MTQFSSEPEVWYDPKHDRCFVVSYIDGILPKGPYPPCFWQDTIDITLMAAVSYITRMRVARSDQTSYRMISKLSKILGDEMFISLWNLAKGWPALLDSLQNLRPIRNLQTTNSRLRDFARSYDKTTYMILLQIHSILHNIIWSYVVSFYLIGIQETRGMALVIQCGCLQMIDRYKCMAPG